MRVERWNIFKIIGGITGTVGAVLLLAACAGNQFGSSDSNPAEKKCAVSVNYDKNSQFSSKEFKNPPAAYRIVPFWSWNEDMEPAEVRRQLRLMKKAGWGGSMVHSRTGLLTDYLGEDWFKAVDACIDESMKLGMLVWLYDEDKWPSGYSGGSVLKANEDYACKSLFARPVGAEVPPEASPLGKPVNGIQVYAYRAKQGNPRYNGTSYVDTLSHKAMEQFKRDAYESYYNRYKDFYGDVIVAEFTDEPAQMSRGKSDCWTNSVVYSSDMLEAFKQMHGFDPVPHLYKLFTDCDGAMKFRLQYYRTANDLFEKNFMKQIGDFCAERNISLTGHCMAETNPFTQQMWSGRIMPYFRHMGIPGIDHLSRSIIEVYTGKQCQSVCNQYGKTRMLSEMYGVSGGSLSFEDREWITYQQMVLGVNQIVPHLSLFSMTGCRKRDYPQNINYQQSWWDVNSEIDVPLARACYALAQGKYAADILFISPQESMQCVWKADPEEGNPMGASKSTRERAAQLENSLNATLFALLGSQLTFDLGDEQLLEEDGFIEGKKIGIGQMSYKVVVLSDMENMRPSTLEKLQKFADAGGLILRTGNAPKYLDGEKSAELDKFFASVKRVNPSDLGAEIEKYCPAMVSVAGKGDSSLLWTHIRNFNDGSRLVMLTNLSRKDKFDGKVSIRGNYSRAQIFDIESGDIRDVYAQSKNGNLELPLSLETAGAIFLRVSNEPAVAKAPEKVEVISDRELSGWGALRLDDNSMLLDYASFSFGGGEFKVNGEVPAIEIMRYLDSIKYDGDLTVTYSFKAKDFDSSRKLHLVVEYPERAIIKVNGKEVKYAGLPAWRDFRWMPIDITGLVKNGENKIEMHYKDFKHGDPAVYKPQWRRYGTEIEAVYLVGDFSVTSVDTGLKIKNTMAERFKAKETQTVVISKKDLAITNPQPVPYGNVTKSGLPFYSGKLAYTKNVKFPEIKDGERLFLKLQQLDCPVAEVLINGNSVGVIKNAPYEIDVTDYVRGNECEVEIVLYASLRNIMDAPHNVIGDIYSIWPNMFYIMDLPSRKCDYQNGKNKDAVKASLEPLQKFADGSWKSKKWLMDYCQVSFGDIGKVSLITKKFSK